MFRAAGLVALAALSIALLDPLAAFAQAPQSKFAEVNGARLHYLVAGKGDPVVLLHGYAQTSHMWLPLISKLADGGPFLIEQGKMVATNVEGVLVKGRGHWLMKEAPDQVIPKLVEFLNR
jgi:hypothetical protein